MLLHSLSLSVSLYIFLCLAAPMRGFAKIRSIFEVSITFDHTQKSDEDHPGVNLDVDLEIGKQFENQLNVLNFLFYFLHVLILWLVMYFILEIIYFKFNYFGSVEFRNRYITKELLDYNARYHKQFGIDLFPLRTTEEKRFIPVSCIIFKRERVRLLSIANSR